VAASFMMAGILLRLLLLSEIAVDKKSLLKSRSGLRLTARCVSFLFLIISEGSVGNDCHRQYYAQTFGLASSIREFPLR
jgi:hypothetical protein